MLRLAIDAGLPLIHVSTDDPVNIGAVLSYIAGQEVGLGETQRFKDVEAGSVTYVDYSKLDWSRVYSAYVQISATLIVVGGPNHKAFFEAGHVTAPKTMIQKFVAKYAKADILKITDALAGLTIKQSVEVSKMAMSDFGEFSVRAVQTTRRRLFGAIRGLEQVDVAMPLYLPPQLLTRWLETEGPFVFGDAPDILRPRGLLFGGPTGTGKTVGAKYLAEALEQPLYRLDIGIVMSKWAGESEENLQDALTHAENCAPCVILIDEVEKLFGGNDEGVSTRLLASLLWWLQEHKSRVFTVMTTNKDDAIPPELIRPGRIDRLLSFPLLGQPQVNKFACYLLDELIEIAGLTQDQLNELALVFTTGTGKSAWSHAEVTAQVFAAIKAALLDKRKHNK